MTAWGGHQDCPDPRLVFGECEQHGQQRFVLKRCKRRDCEYCGALGRYRIAQRIALGVRKYWPCSWQVLSFDTEDAEAAEWKPKAVRMLADYVSWLREKMGMPDLQYAATYELTQRGRLHIDGLSAVRPFVDSGHQSNSRPVLDTAPFWLRCGRRLSE